MPVRNRWETAMRHQQCGVGLLEVLIAILVLAIGVLGAAAMQATALRNSQSALERSQAVIQTYSIMDAMRANRTAAISAGSYDLAMASPCVIPAAGALAASDLNSWLTSLQAALGPSACGSITREGTDGDVVVTVQWNDSRGKSGNTAESITTRTQL